MFGLLTPLVPLQGRQAPSRSVANRPIRRVGLAPTSATTFTGCCGMIKIGWRRVGARGLQHGDLLPLVGRVPSRGVRFLDMATHYCSCPGRSGSVFANFFELFDLTAWWIHSQHF